MIPVPLIVYESLCRYFGESLVRTIYYPTRVSAHKA